VFLQTAVPRPTIPAEFGSKVPTSIRQRYLSLMVDECLKIYPTPQDAYDRVSVGVNTLVADILTRQHKYFRNCWETDCFVAQERF